jgi:hypothetical protein
MSLELKIKSKHLSEEARIIRFEEHKLFKQYQWALNNYRAAGNNDMYPRWNDKAFMSYASLNKHRRHDVRNENRATFLARAYISGQNYLSVETKRKPEREFEFYNFIVPRIVNMVAKYGADKVPIKIYDRTKGGYIDNPELSKIKQAIEAWITTEA